MNGTKPEEQTGSNSDVETTPVPQSDPAEDSVAAAESKKSCSTPAKCRHGRHLPLFISVIAILLAGYSVITSYSNAPLKSTDTASRLHRLDAEIANLGITINSINSQLSELGQDVQSNRDNLIQSRLKKLLLNIQEIATIAGSETQSKIMEIEDLVKGMTTSGQAPPEAPQESKSVDPSAGTPSSTAKPAANAKKITAEVTAGGPDATATPPEASVVDRIPTEPGTIPENAPTSRTENGANTPTPTETF